MIMKPLLLLAALAGSLAAAGDEILLASQLRPPAEELGPGWTGPTGLVLDDLDTPPPAGAVDTATLTALRQQMKALGVRSLADFTYRRKDHPEEQMTLRVFVFASEAQCRDWIQKRYQTAGWEKHYRKVDGAWDTGLDSLEMRKRIVATGPVWITSGTVSDQADHRKALDLVLVRLKKLREEQPADPVPRPQP